jgi:hypothetical protein
MTGIVGTSNFGTLREVVGVASTLLVTGFPGSTTAGVPGSVTVTLKDQAGNLATNYAGTIHFMSTDPQGVLPADYTFGAADGGVHSFVNGVTLKTAGVQSITATDTVNPSLSGTEFSITVSPGTATQLVFVTQPGSAVYGSVLSSQPALKSCDAYGNDSTVGLGASKMVSLSLTAGSGALTGTTSLDIGTGAGNGTVSFSGLQVNSAGNGKQITASVSGLSSAVSSAFSVSQALPSMPTMLHGFTAIQIQPSAVPSRVFRMETISRRHIQALLQQPARRAAMLSCLRLMTRTESAAIMPSRAITAL